MGFVKSEIMLQRVQWLIRLAHFQNQIQVAKGASAELSPFFLLFVAVE